MKMVRRLVDVIIDLVTLLVVIYLLFLGVCGVSRWIPYIVLSGSMEPSIRTGSLCIVDTDVPFEQIRSGDVIAFETGNGQLVTHRAVAFLEDSIETKGDANTVTDGFTTTKENYRGKTLFSIPYLGYAVNWLQTVRGKIISISGISSLFLFGWFLDEETKSKAVRKKRQESAGGNYGGDKE